MYVCGREGRSIMYVWVYQCTMLPIAYDDIIVMTMMSSCALDVVYSPVQGFIQDFLLGVETLYGIVN